jgi:hypothetical protein
MTSASYLTEIEIIRELRLPEKVGRIVMAQWKIHPTFPKPVPGMSGRRFMPSVERWLFKHHGLDIAPDAGPAVPVAGTGERFDEWRKALKARKPRNAGPDLPPPPVRMAPNVVATIGFGGKRLSKDDASGVATVDSDPASA